MIDGLTYSNCLEALNLSYAKGFRLFELDILKTSDGKYVAAHDWKKWKRMNSYSGDTPVSYKVFKQYKLHNKYTPLGIDDINNWFAKHSDAILVTDKINEPKAFSEVFIDPNRLMMELFTKKSVEEAAKVEMMIPILNQKVIKTLKWQEILDLKIKYVAVSRFFIRNNKSLLLKLKNNKIKVFVYNINVDGGVSNTGIDEDYVTKYELDYVYGMYADKWEFK